MKTHIEATDREAWIQARREVLAQEKALTRQSDELAAQRRALPWLRIAKEYEFESNDGKQTLRDLFGTKSQLVIYHFMFGPDWEEGCKACSFWADHFDRIIPHLAARDVSLVAVSRGPLARLTEFAARMGWQHPWVSSLNSDFNQDFGVTLSREELAAGTAQYNYATAEGDYDERPGVSVFARDDEGAIFHTYSCYARGLDILNSAYRFLDLVPKGRDEDDFPFPMAWLNYRDAYETNQ